MATFREFLIAEAAQIVFVKYDPEWEEFTVPSPDGREEATYHTDDKQDAMDTAKQMYGPEAIIKIKRKR